VLPLSHTYKRTILARSWEKEGANQWFTLKLMANFKDVFQIPKFQ
jgi:hypothetical protein